MTLRAPFLSALAAALGLWPAQAAWAQAQPACDDLPNPLYLQVGDTQEPLMKTLGKALRNSATTPMTLVYVTSGSCTNIEAIYNDTKITANPKYVPSEEEDPAWDPSKPSPVCTIAEGGHTLEVANSALFVSACNPADPPDGIKLFQGPNQAYAFVVPQMSPEVAITAEEAYFAFGFGAEGQVTPWDDEAFLFIRPTTKSTLLALAAAIRVPGDKWKGTQLESSSMVLSGVTSSTNPDKTIGILGTEIYDRNRETTNVLAYRAYGQTHAYFPDSDASSFDKRNVRDGHYVPWSPTVWITKVDGEDKPTLENAAFLISLILGQETEQTPDFEPLEAVVSVGLVPECAMHVTRSVEGGDLSLYQPAEPCGCYYDSKVAEAPASCVVCDEDTPCEKGTCRHGFCEAT
ncbi:MAG: hypothetical protein ABW321_17100 [Polyangiales bacterium]